VWIFTVCNGFEDSLILNTLMQPDQIGPEKTWLGPDQTGGGIGK
jgi:hypothetical protein